MSDERRERKKAGKRAGGRGAVSFFKMHGLGNDYVYLDAVTEPALERSLDLPALARRVSDRHTGVGSDGLILVCKPTPAGKKQGAHARMRMFNADGSESGMCGNGIRCVAKLAHDHLGITASPMRIETGAGSESVVRAIVPKVRGGMLVEATVDMGEPRLKLAEIPAVRKAMSRTEHPYQSVLHVHGAEIRATFVGMGNPHAVVFVSVKTPGKASAGAAALEPVSELMLALGPMIENHPAFPRRVNAHFAVAHSRTHASVFTWERGSGATRACGTGACAVLVAGVLTGLLARNARITLPGGDLRIAWDAKTGHVMMTGPAEMSFRGELDVTAAHTRKTPKPSKASSRSRT